MTTKTYKGYTIRIVGLSHHIFRPGQYEKVKAGELLTEMSPGFQLSVSASKRWINTDIQRNQNENQSQAQ